MVKTVLCAARGHDGTMIARRPYPSILIITLTVSGAGCSSPDESAQKAAIFAVRRDAYSLQKGIAEVAKGKSGAMQVSAVRFLVSGAGLTVRPQTDGVVVTGAMTEKVDKGGGLFAGSFRARLCLRYDVTAETGRTSVVDAPCPSNVQDTVGADATVTLEG